MCTFAICTIALSYLISACTHTENIIYNDLWIDVENPLSPDTLAIDTLHTLEFDAPTITTGGADAQSPLDAWGLYAADGQLYSANYGQRCVDIYDATTGTHLKSVADSISTGDRRLLEVRDVAVRDSFLFATGINPSQIYLFNRTSHTFYGRLGDGNWSSGITVHPFCVAADSRFVYVKDQRDIIKVFDRTLIEPDCKLNYSATLAIDNTNPGWNNYYDMQVDEQSGKLYVMHHFTNTIYCYHTDHIVSGDLTPVAYAGKAVHTRKVYSMSFSPNYVWYTYQESGNYCVGIEPRHRFNYAHLQPQAVVRLHQDAALPLTVSVAAITDQCAYVNLGRTRLVALLHKEHYIYTIK